MSLIITMLVLGIIITIHEFDHFLFVKLNRVGVTGFPLGMGPRLLSFEKDGTQYSFKVPPFGGSCMMLGEDGGIIGESMLNSKSIWTRISAVAVRPVFSFILIFGLSMVLIGITGYDTTRLVGVVGGYPTRAAGTEAGDVIKPINGGKVHPYKDVSQCLFIHPQRSFTVTWERTEEGGGTERFSTELAPVFSTENNQYMMGVQFSPAPSMAENIRQLLIHNAYGVQYWIHHAFDAFYMMSHSMVSVNDTSGPMEIVNTTDIMVGEAAPHGISAVAFILISFTILLSISLGVINLFPTPALDGGRLISFIVEAVRGKPIDKEREGMVHMAEMMILLALMVLILFNDVRKLF